MSKKCPICGKQLSWDPVLNMWICKHCEASFDNYEADNPELDKD